MADLARHFFNRMRLLNIKLKKIRLLYLFKVAVGTIDLNFSDDQGTSFDEKLNHISWKKLVEVCHPPWLALLEQEVSHLQTPLSPLRNSQSLKNALLNTIVLLSLNVLLILSKVINRYTPRLDQTRNGLTLYLWQLREKNMILPLKESLFFLFTQFISCHDNLIVLRIKETR